MSKLSRYCRAVSNSDRVTSQPDRRLRAAGSARSRRRRASRTFATRLSAMRPEPRHVHRLGQLAGQRQQRADAVRRVVHRRQAFPVAGPAGHFLLMRAAHELEPAQLAAARTARLTKRNSRREDDRLHHHVVLLLLARLLHDRPALLDGRRHRHRAGDVLAGLQGGQAHAPRDRGSAC